MRNNRKCGDASECARIRVEIDAAYAAIPGTRFMDPPDGGSPTLGEQVQRMAEALEEAEDAAGFMLFEFKRIRALTDDREIVNLCEHAIARATQRPRPLVMECSQLADELRAKEQYVKEMSTLAGAKRHYQDGIEVGGETLRGAILRLLAERDLALEKAGQWDRYSAYRDKRNDLHNAFHSLPPLARQQYKNMDAYADDLKRARLTIPTR